MDDRLAIEELIKNSNIGVMRADTTLWSSTWAEDGVWKIDILEEPATGKSDIVKVFETFMSRIEFVSMTGFSSELTIEGDKAHGKVYSQELIFPRAGGQRILVGCFHDQYIKRGGNWFFHSREYETLRRGPLVND